MKRVVLLIAVLLMAIGAYAQTTVVYSDEGMWKRASPLEYIYNYYQEYATPNHPFDKAALIRYSNGSHYTTCRDANGHLLFDFDHDGEIDSPVGGYVFHEHNARGSEGKLLGAPFTNFWFDDNNLALLMSSAYGRPLPQGLSWYPDFTRWAILGGNATGWTPYPPSKFLDLISLNAMYALANGNVAKASTLFIEAIDIAKPTWDAPMQRYEYANADETYHVGLMLMVAEHLIARSAEPLARITQHALSLRSCILSRQEVRRTEGGVQYLGWRTNYETPTSLINTETIACATLGLAAAAQLVFEVGLPPLEHDQGASFFYRPHNVLSGVVGLSRSEGLMARSPSLTGLPPKGAAIEVRIYARSPTASQGPASNTALSFDMYCGPRHVASHNITCGLFPRAANEWYSFRYNVILPSAEPAVFELRWSGSHNVDVAKVSLTWR